MTSVEESWGPKAPRSQFTRIRNLIDSARKQLQDPIMKVIVANQNLQTSIDLEARDQVSKTTRLFKTIIMYAKKRCLLEERKLELVRLQDTYRYPEDCHLRDTTGEEPGTIMCLPCNLVGTRPITEKENAYVQIQIRRGLFDDMFNPQLQFFTLASDIWDTEWMYRDESSTLLAETLKEAQREGSVEDISNLKTRVAHRLADGINEYYERKSCCSYQTGMNRGTSYEIIHYRLHGMTDFEEVDVQTQLAHSFLQGYERACRMSAKGYHYEEYDKLLGYFERELHCNAVQVLFAYFNDQGLEDFFKKFPEDGVTKVAFLEKKVVKMTKKILRHYGSDHMPILALALTINLRKFEDWDTRSRNGLQIFVERFIFRVFPHMNLATSIPYAFTDFKQKVKNSFCVLICRWFYCTNSFNCSWFAQELIKLGVLQRYSEWWFDDQEIQPESFMR